MQPRIKLTQELKNLLRHAGDLPGGNRYEPPSSEELRSHELAAQLLKNVYLTAQFTYHFPQFPNIVAEPLIWGFDDLAPTLPELRRFIRFWNLKLIGPLVQVDVDGCQLVTDREIRALEKDKIFRLH
jgi:uncharacterized protein Usg